MSKYIGQVTGDVEKGEKIIGKAGEDMGDPWKEGATHGFLSKNITPEYKEFLKKMHMVDLAPAGKNINKIPSKKIEQINQQWRKIQEKKKQRITKQLEKIEKHINGYTSNEVNNYIKERDK